MKLAKVEIIETYWNVNFFKELTEQGTQYRNNRNILECKFMSDKGILFSFMEIIETYWNVNDFKIVICSGRLSEIIETYWNVNVPWLLLDDTTDARNNRNILECKCIMESSCRMGGS